MTTTTPATTPDAPDWDAIPHDVVCPLCEYNLRGLSDPRCPECGARFHWPEVTDPAKRLHPYLFEHHPERNFTSFVQTLLGTLRPARFWSSLAPSQLVDPSRLRKYWLVSALFASAVFIAEWARATVTWYDGLSWWMAAETAWKRDRLLGTTLSQLVFWLAWPWLTLAALQVFRISMRRAKVRTDHVLRCVVYSFDLGVWFGVAGVAWAFYNSFAVLTQRPGPASFQDEIAFRVIIFLGLTIGVVSLRLAQAYRLYMRFDRAGWTVFAAQLIALLAALNALVIWEEWVRHWF